MYGAPSVGQTRLSGPSLLLVLIPNRRHMTNADITLLGQLRLGVDLMERLVEKGVLVRGLGEPR